MIALEEYRAVIGNFYAKAKYLSRKSVGLENFTSKYQNFYKGHLCWHHHIANILTEMLIFIFIALFSFHISSLVLLHGDEELTPGPSNTVDRVVLGTFHQCDGRFGHTAGIQGACNYLYAFCWSQICGVNMWNSIDLDHVLLEELPHTVTSLNSLNKDRLKAFNDFKNKQQKCMK